MPHPVSWKSGGPSGILGAPSGILGASSGHPRATLGASSGIFGASSGILGISSGHLRASSGHPRRILGHLRGTLGIFTGHPRASSGILGISSGHPRASSERQTESASAERLRGAPALQTRECASMYRFREFIQPPDTENTFFSVFDAALARERRAVEPTARAARVTRAARRRLVPKPPAATRPEPLKDSGLTRRRRLDPARDPPHPRARRRLAAGPRPPSPPPPGSAASRLRPAPHGAPVR